VNREEQQIAHESNGSTLANLGKTVRGGPFRLKFINSHPTGTTDEFSDLFEATPIPQDRPLIKRRRPLELKFAGALCRQLRRRQAPQEKRRIAHLICLNLLSMLRHN
jgi:hypothetical protein